MFAARLAGRAVLISCVPIISVRAHVARSSRGTDVTMSNAAFRAESCVVHVIAGIAEGTSGGRTADETSIHRVGTAVTSAVVSLDIVLQRARLAQSHRLMNGVAFRIQRRRCLARSFQHVMSALARRTRTH